MKKLLSLFLTVIFVLSGCSSPQSSSEPLPAASQMSVMDQVQQLCGEEYLIYAGDNFTLYTGNGNAFIDDGSGQPVHYIFAANYKSGGYRIELYDENNIDSANHILIHMDGEKITDVMFFTEPDMYNTFGRWNLISASTNDRLTIGSLYSQYDGITINYDFMSRTITTDRYEIADLDSSYQPRATRQDGLYTIYSHYPSAALDESSTWIRDNTTGNMTKLSDGSTDVTGFMADGNLYTMNYSDYKELDTDGNLLFALSDNFPTGLVDEEKGIVRCVRGVYKDINHSRYYVMYYDSGSSGSTDYVPGTTLLYDTYSLAVLDESGAVKQIIETGKYVETSKNHSVELSVRAVNEHTISFYREVYNSLLFEVFVDLDTEKITLFDYRRWE